MEAQPYSVVRRSPDATLEDFNDRASFASARYRQPGATGSLDMLSGHPPEIILAFVAKNSNPPQARAISRRRASALSRPVGVGERSCQIPSGVAHGLRAQDKWDESFCRRRRRYCLAVGTARCAWHD